MTAQLPDMDFPGRLARLRAELDGAGCDALLVTKLVNVRYLTGFSGSAGQLLVRPEDATFVTDGRYATQIESELRVAATVEITQEPHKVLPIGTTRLGLEADEVSWAQQRRIAGWFPEAELVPTEGLVDVLRQTKDAGEVARIERAAGTVDSAMTEVLPLLAERPSEQRFALELDAEVRRHGADGSAYPTIVASGPNAALPHARPGERRIDPGDVVIVDVGAVVDGYRSDMTRTFSFGEPHPEVTRLYDVVRDAQQAGVEAVSAGVGVAAVDGATRDIIEAAGLGDGIRHAAGHGVGLEIHEAPRVSVRSDAELALANVVTVEPGVYFDGFGGVRIEDTVVVDPTGARRLTKSPKQLVVT